MVPCAGNSAGTRDAGIRENARHHVITSRTGPPWNPYNYWVCVVVVEVAGTACTAGVVVVVLVVVGGALAQLDSDDAITTAAKQAMISFFISMIFLFGCFTSTSLRHRLVTGHGV